MSEQKKRIYRNRVCPNCHGDGWRPMMLVGMMDEYWRTLFRRSRGYQCKTCNERGKVTRERFEEYQQEMGRRAFEKLK